MKNTTWCAFIKPDGELEKVVLCPRHAMEHPFEGELAPIHDLHGCRDLSCKICYKNIGIWLSQEQFDKEAA